MGKLVRASAVQFVADVTSTVVTALVTVFVVRTLGVGAFGQYVLVIALVNVSGVPLGGIRGAVIKRMSAASGASARGRMFVAGSTLQLGLSSALALAVLVFADTVAEFTGLAAVGITAFILVLNTTGMFALSALRGEERVELSSLIKAGWFLLRSTLQFALVATGSGVRGLLHAEVLASGAVILVGSGLLVEREQISLPTRDEFESLYEFGRFGWLSVARRQSYAWTDTVVLGAIFVGQPAVVGAYELAWRVSGLFTLLPSAISQVTFPSSGFGYPTRVRARAPPHYSIRAARSAESEVPISLERGPAEMLTTVDHHYRRR